MKYKSLMAVLLGLTISFSALANFSSYLFINKTKNCDTISIKSLESIFSEDYSILQSKDCADPSDQDVENITSEGADLLWTENATATVWNIRIGEQGYDTTGTDYYTNNTGNVTVDTLFENTSYDWYIRSSCGDDEFSEWVGPSEFSTYCSATNANLSEDFDDIEVGDIPECWMDIVISSSENSSVGVYALGSPHSESHHLRMYNYDDASVELLLISPQFNDLTDQTNQIRFYAKSTSPQDLLIGTISDPTDENTFTTHQTITLTTSYIEYAVEFGASYTEDDEYIAFKHGAGTAYRTIYIDDIEYEEIPTCKSPIDQAVSDETLTEADLSWTEVGASTNWDIYITEVGGDAPEDETTPTIDDTGDNPYNWTDGDEGTTYEWYVRSDCGEDNTDVSHWKGYHTFNTLITNDDCPGAIELPVGYSEDWVQGTNSGATESNNNPHAIPDPECAHYVGADIWYSAVVPASGYLIINSQTVAHSDFTNSGMAIYSGNCNSLTFIECNDNGGEGSMSEIIYDDLTSAGNTIYIRFWNYNNEDTDPFEITAYTNPTNAEWTGNTNNDWHETDNWNPNGVPGDITNITIPVGLSNYPTITESANCKNLTIKSDANGTASIVGAQYLNVNETANIETYFTAYSSASTGWHFLSSPMDEYTILGSDFVDGTHDLYRWGESTVADERWLNNDGGTFGHTEFENALGYLVAYANAETKTFTGGALNTGNYSKTCTYTAGKGDGWNLLGNPYCSAIDWDLLTKPATVDASVHIIKAFDGTYIDWNGTVGDLTDGIIPPHQGFFVQVSAATNIGIYPADQVHPNHAFYKSDNDYKETLKVSLKGICSENNTYFQFRDDASTDFDRHADSYKLFGWASIAQVYSELNGIKYSINCLNHSAETMSIPLGIKLNMDENLTLNFSGLNSFYNSIRIDLEDIKTGTTVNIREYPSYSFSALISDEPNRFLLHFNGATDIEEMDDMEEAQAPIVYSVKHAIYINSNEAITAQVFIYSVNGQLIAQDRINGEKLKKIDLNISTGIYLVNIQTCNNVYTQKVMIE